MRSEVRQIDILKDIANMINDGEEHNVEIQVSSAGIMIYLEYFPNICYREHCIIPIQYDMSCGEVYIPLGELAKRFNPKEGGIEMGEIKIINKIMKCVEKNKEKINELCMLFNMKRVNDYSEVKEWL